MYNKIVTIILVIIIIYIIINLFILLNKNNISSKLKNEEIYINELKKLNYIYYDENNKKIDNFDDEITEQLIALKYINPDDNVLELGARYGTVTCAASSKLVNGKIISVEPDKNVWNVLEKNLINNKCQNNIVKGFISNNPQELVNPSYGGYGITVEKSDIPNYTLDEIKNKYNINNFSVLIADCEGCLENFIKENPELIRKELELITLEEDNAEKCNYENVNKMLRKNNFKLVENTNNIVNRTIWIKKI